MDKKCKNCKFYYSETKTATGIGTAYCDEKWSKREGLPHGYLQTVVFEDETCRYWKPKEPSYTQLEFSLA